MVKEQYGDCPDEWNLTPDEEFIEDLESKIIDLEHEIEQLKDEVTELEDDLLDNSKIIVKLEKERDFYKQYVGKSIIDLYERNNNERN